jgi:hypothetical protein
MRRLSAFEAAIVPLLPDGRLRRGSTPRNAALCVVALEFVAGGALLAVQSPVFPIVAGLAVLLFAGFSAASITAYRQRVPCGCFGGAHKRATRADVLRTLGLTLAAAVVAAAALSGASPHLTAGSVVVSLAVTAVVWLPVVIARQALHFMLQFKPAGGAPDTGEMPARRGLATRRRFLGQVGGAAAALTGLFALELPAVALGAPSCEQIEYNCTLCCRTKFGAGAKRNSCLQCCYGCYIGCVHREFPCHDIMEQYCDNCWIS